MVGQLIRLKLRIIWNTVRRQTAVLVLAILGTLQFGTMYVGALVGTAFLAQSEGAATLAAVLPIAGSRRLPPVVDPADPVLSDG